MEKAKKKKPKKKLGEGLYAAGENERLSIRRFSFSANSNITLEEILNQHNINTYVVDQRSLKIGVEGNVKRMKMRNIRNLSHDGNYVILEHSAVRNKRILMIFHTILNRSDEMSEKARDAEKRMKLWRSKYRLLQERYGEIQTSIEVRLKYIDKLKEKRVTDGKLVRKYQERSETDQKRVKRLEEQMKTVTKSLHDQKEINSNLEQKFELQREFNENLQIELSFLRNIITKERNKEEENGEGEETKAKKTQSTDEKRKSGQR